MIQQKEKPAPVQNTNSLFGKWDFPSVDLLNDITNNNTITEAEIEEKSLIIQRTFLQFGIDVTMKGQCVGPTVVQYRLEPSE